MKSQRLILRLTNRVASIPASPIQLAALFTVTVILRNLLECISEGMLFPAAAFLYHFPVAYVFPMAGLTLILSTLSGYPLARLTRLMVYAWTLTILPPLIDFLAGTSNPIGYFPLDRSNAVHFFLNFFNPSVALEGTTTGIRVEAALGCLLAGIFSWGTSQERRLARGILTTVVMTPVFLVFFTWPSLVHAAMGGLFPVASGAQEFYQWHASTAPWLTGEFHYTIFLVDMIPVTVILALFLRKLRPLSWKTLVHGTLREPWTLLAPAAGALCAAASSDWLLTFADAAAIMGAFLAASLAVLSIHAGCRWKLRGILLATALAIGSAAGWATTVLILLTASVSLLPGPRRLVMALSAAAAAAAAASPAGLDPTPAALLILLPAAISGAAREARWTGLATGLLAVVSALMFQGLRPTAYEVFHRELTDSFNRNGRLDMALPAAIAQAGCGGDILTLARAELSAGDPDKARWAYGLAVAGGDSSADAVRTGFNLAFLHGSTGELDSLIAAGRSLDSDQRGAELGDLLLGHAVENGDTLMIGRLMESYGSYPVLLSSYSMACASLGDLTRAAVYARAAASHPLAESGQIAWAIHVTAIEGGSYDSLYEIGIDRFPGSVELMTARLMAPLAAGREPDREDLLEICLRLRPMAPGVLRTGAAWHLENGEPGLALTLAERALAVNRDPDLELILLTCSAAAAAGEHDRLMVHARYGLTLYPGNTEIAMFRRMGDDDLTDVPGSDR